MIFYRPDFIPARIMIVGCGGTGSRLVPLLAQFIKTCSWVTNPELVLIDDDVVEPKNLARQNFIKPDVDKYKAVVLANRYSKAFDLQITPIVTRVREFCKTSASAFTRSPQKKNNTPEGQEQALLYETFNRFSGNSIIIMCVDSPQARRDILSHCMWWKNYNACGRGLIIIDAGNENDFGQVTCSMLTTPRYDKALVSDLPKSLPGDMQIPSIPTDVSYFKDMTAISAGSCADLDQTMAINTAMATTIFSIVQNFYYAKPMNFHRIDVSLSHGSIPQYINLQWLNKMQDQDNLLGLHATSRSDFSAHIRKFRAEVFEPFLLQVKKAEEDAERALLQKGVTKLEKMPPKEETDLTGTLGKGPKYQPMKRRMVLTEDDIARIATVESSPQNL